MLTIIFILISVFGVLGIIEPETPIGIKISNFKLINNHNLILFFHNYKLIIKFLANSILIILIFLIFINYDFILSINFFFGFFYTSMFALLVFGIFYKDKTKTTNKTKKQIRNLLFKYFIYLIFFIFNILFTHNIFNIKYLNGDVEKKYQKVLTDSEIKFIIPFNDNTSEDYRIRYKNETELISNINIIHQYQKEYKFSFTLDSIKNENNFLYSKYINNAKHLFSNYNYNQTFKNIIIEIVELKNKRIKGNSIFPTESQPSFIANYLIIKYINEFTILATGSKIYITYLFQSIIKKLSILGLIFLILLIIFLTLKLTLVLSKYNEKYCKNNNKFNNYFFISLTFLGLLLTLFSLIL